MREIFAATYIWSDSAIEDFPVQFTLSSQVEFYLELVALGWLN